MSVDIEKLEAVIESAMKMAVRMGHVMGKAAPHGGGDCICPLYAVCVANNHDTNTFNGRQLLELTEEQGYDFVSGYDDIERPTREHPLRQLGRKFRLAVDAGLYARAVVCPEMP